MGQSVVCQESNSEGLGDVIGFEIARGDCTSDDYHGSFMKKTAFSMSKNHFNVNDEGTILQSHRNARMANTIQVDLASKTRALT